MEIKAIAIDMDGTLLDESGNVTEELAARIFQLRNRGIKIILATGRTLQEVYESLPESIIVDGLVAANGMACYIGDAKLVQYQLEPSLVENLIAKARAKNLYYEVHDLDGVRYALEEDRPSFEAELRRDKEAALLESEYMEREAAVYEQIRWVNKLTGTQTKAQAKDKAQAQTHAHAPHHDKLGKLPTDKVIKLYFFSMAQAEMDAWKCDMDEIAAQSPFSQYASSMHNVEIMTSDVSKATGLEHLLGEFGLSFSELMAVGDSENDIPMFEAAGCAVAMKNAADTVKNVADRVTEFSNGENGLCKFLQDYF